MDSHKLLRATTFSQMRREKQKKSNDDAATDEDLGAAVLRSDVVWLNNVENDRPQKTAVGNWRHSP